MFKVERCPACIHKTKYAGSPPCTYCNGEGLVGKEIYDLIHHDCNGNEDEGPFPVNEDHPESKGLTPEPDEPEDGPDDLDLLARDEAYAEVWHAQFDDDPNPYHGNYSEE